MDTLNKDGIEDGRNKQEIPIEPSSKISPGEEGRRHTNSRSHHYGDLCERCGFKNICEGPHYHRGHHKRHRRWKRFKKAVKSLLIVMGICFLVSLLLTYITGSLPILVERIISKNIEKAIQRTTAGFVDGELSPEKLKNLAKNIDVDKLKGQALQSLGGGEGDRAERQSPEERKKDIEEYMSHDNFEKLKEQYKDKYREMLGR